MKKRLISLFTSLMMILGLAMVVPLLQVNAAGEIYWPVPGHTNKSQGWHNGNAIDISDATIGGADVIAACGGTVCNIFLCTKTHLNDGDCHGFGTGLVINGDDGRVYQYAHMQANSIPSNVYYGAYVSAGQRIGKVGTTGYSTGNHLHFGISLEKYWYKSGINPLNENYIYSSPHTHSYVGTITKQPTCTTTGIKTFTCSCGNAYTEEIPATGHSFINKVISPTSTQKGYTLHTCSVCSYSYEDSYVDPPVLNEDGWYYCDTLPSDIKSDKYKIEYNSSYEKIQQTSPGEEWTNAGVVKNEWQNSGGEYTTETPLDTSDARILIKECFYHWCIPGASMGSEGNYEQTSKFNHYDEISLPNPYVHVRSQGDDNGHTYYLLSWDDGNKVYCHSGEQCDGSWGYHDYRCQAWYKHYVYQDRVKVELYKFTKQSGWKPEAENGADSVVCRYREIEDIKGDLNSDNTLTMNDAVLLQKYLLNLKKLTVEQLKLADMNSDGRVNIFDLALLKESLK